MATHHPTYYIAPSAAARARAGLRSAESMTVAVPRTLSLLVQFPDTFRRHVKTFLFMTLLGALVVIDRLMDGSIDR